MRELLIEKYEEPSLTDEFGNKFNNPINMEEIKLKETEPGHYCPYCGHKEMQINNYFTHIEIFHPDKPLIC